MSLHDEANLFGWKELATSYTVSKSIHVVCATSFFYYMATQLDEEKTYIWSRKWSSGKFMYLLTRYSGAFFIIYTCYALLGLPWGGLTDGRATRADSGRGLDVLRSTCLFGSLYIGPGTFAMFAALLIVEMRVYALYSCSKRVLALMVALSIALLVTALAQGFGIAYRVTSPKCAGLDCHTEVASRGVPLTTCLAFSIPLSALCWLVMSVIELILVSMVFWKYRSEKKSQQDATLKPSSATMKDITAAVGRNATVYLAIMLAGCVAGTCLAFVSQTDDVAENPVIFALLPAQNLAYQTVVVTLMTILAPRLIVNLRREYSLHVPVVKAISRPFLFKGDELYPSSSSVAVLDIEEADASGSAIEGRSV